LQTAVAMLFVGLLIFLAHLFAGLFARTRVPDVLWLFAIGLALGPVLGIVTPGSFGIAGPVFTTVTLVFILFEGGTDLKFDALEDAWKDTVTLTTLNFVASTAITATALHVCTDLGVLLSVATGAIVGSTSTAVVSSLSRRLAMRPAAAAVALMESAVGDVFTLAIPIALLDAWRTTEVDTGGVAVQLVVSFLIAVAMGVAGAFVWSLLLHRVRTLQNGMCTTPAFVFFVYGVVELLGGSGPVAALTFGIVLGNAELLTPSFLVPRTDRRDRALTGPEKAFFSEAVFLLRTFFLVYAGLSIRLDDRELLLLGFAITVMLFAVRVPVVALSLSRRTTARDASLIAVMVPKGLGAAVLATIPLQMGVAGGDVIQTVVFAVILASTLLTTVLVVLVDRTPVGRVYESFFAACGFVRGEAAADGPVPGTG
jgi:potassium/hydrogen antiporter